MVSALVLLCILNSLRFSPINFRNSFSYIFLGQSTIKLMKMKRHTVQTPHFLDLSIIIFSTKRRASGIPLALKDPARRSMELWSSSARSASLKDPDSVRFKLRVPDSQTVNRNFRWYIPAERPAFNLVSWSSLINNLPESLLRYVRMNMIMPSFVIYVIDHSRCPKHPRWAYVLERSWSTQHPAVIK